MNFGAVYISLCPEANEPPPTYVDTNNLNSLNNHLGPSLETKTNLSVYNSDLIPVRDQNEVSFSTATI